MSVFSCPRCSHRAEAETTAPPPCPRCGSAMTAEPTAAAAPAESGLLQSALDEIVDRPAVRTFCSVMSSVVVHVGIFCLVALVAWTTVDAGSAEEQAVPEIHINMIPDDTPNNGTGWRFPGEWKKEDREDAPKVFPDKAPIDKPVGAGDESDSAVPLLPSTSTLKGGGTNPTPGLVGGGAGTVGVNPLGLIGLGGSAGSDGNGRGGGGNGTGKGKGNRPGGGDIIGVDGIPGVPSVVYVVDRSGSMDSVGDFLKNELAKAVNRLNSTQKFNVVWFSDGDPYALSATLVNATEDNKARLFRHLTDVKFSGATDPRAALFKAMELKPKLIYILTDGNFEPEFVDAVTARNTSRLRINAIGFVFPGNEGHANLQKLTERNGGRFKAVEVKSLLGH